MTAAPASRRLPDDAEAFAGRTGRTRIRYRIVVRGETGEPLVGPLEGMTVEVVEAIPCSAGTIVDQVQLQGALPALRRA